MIEIRFHGRGGQGAVTSVELLALAAIEEGKYAQGFPSFGPERRGAPVLAFCRVDDKPIKLRCKIVQPDVVVVLDASLLPIQKPAGGPEGKRHHHLEHRQDRGGDPPGVRLQHTLAVVDANKIAREVLGVPIVNTTMIGALFRATGVVQMESMEAPAEGALRPPGREEFQRHESGV